MRKRILGPLMALLLTFGVLAPPIVTLAAPASVELANTPVELAVATAPQAPELAHVNETIEPVPSWNPSDWFEDALVLGAVIAALVALLKAHVFKTLDGLATLAVSFGLGIGIALLGMFNLPVIGRPHEMDAPAALMFGINAAVFASGGWDLIKGLIVAAFGGKSRGQVEAST